MILAGLGMGAAVEADPVHDVVKKSIQRPLVVDLPTDYIARMITFDAGNPPTQGSSDDPPLVKGTITIPAGKQVGMMVMGGERSKTGIPVDLTPLNQLAPHRLYTLGIPGSTILSDELDQLQAHKSLRMLGLGALGRIEGDFLSPISKIESLEVLKIQATEGHADAISDADFSRLERLKNLEVLELAYTKLTNDGLRSLRRLTNLKELDITSPLISDEGLQHLAGLTKLEKLTLEGGKITGEGCRYLNGLPRLSHLRLNETNVNDQGLRHLSDLASLELLELRETQITSEGLAHLALLERLRSLDLTNAPVRDSGLRHLGQLTSLRQLSLLGAPISDAGLQHLHSLTQLTHLDLYHTQVTQEGVAAFKQEVPDCVVHFDANPESAK